ncbi:MAG: hypothetical protein MK081_10210 [Flavobacteriales bacterium]|nr:hypothetical protein [Flavobacteriales bacterium]
MTDYDDLLAKYRDLEDDELFEIHVAIHEYSEEAQRDFADAIEEKGGMDAFVERLKTRKEKAHERGLLRAQFTKAIKEDLNSELEPGDLTFKYHTEQEVSEIWNDVRSGIHDEIADKRIKPKTIIGGVIGGAIGTVIGTAIWAGQLIGSGSIFVFVGFGVALINYLIIKGITKQSKANIVVVIFTFIATILSIALGSVVYGMVGYQGVER